MSAGGLATARRPAHAGPTPTLQGRPRSLNHTPRPPPVCTFALPTWITRKSNFLAHVALPGCGGRSAFGSRRMGTKSWAPRSLHVRRARRRDGGSGWAFSTVASSPSRLRPQPCCRRCLPCAFGSFFFDVGQRDGSFRLQWADVPRRRRIRTLTTASRSSDVRENFRVTTRGG